MDEKIETLEVGRTASRRPHDAVQLLVATLVLLLTSAPIDANHVSELETEIFHLVNEFPGVIYGAVWAVMQLGNILVVPTTALIVLATRRFRLATALVVSGSLAWLLAKLVKVAIERGRPAELIDDVVLRHAPAAGNGYISGHAAIAVALATVAAPYLGRKGRVVIWLMAALVCVARVYVGAHLPLDVVGGAALGLAIGSLVNVLLGVRLGTSDHRIRSAADGGTRGSGR